MSESAPTELKDSPETPPRYNRDICGDPMPPLMSPDDPTSKAPIARNEETFPVEPGELHEGAFIGPDRLIKLISERGMLMGTGSDKLFAAQLLPTFTALRSFHRAYGRSPCPENLPCRDT